MFSARPLLMCRRGVGLAVLAAVLSAIPTACSDPHPGGDPNGQILHQLEVVDAVLPSGAHVTVKQEIEPKWGPCGQNGWGDVGVAIVFRSGMSTAQMADWARRVISAHNWAVDSTSPITGLPSGSGETDWRVPVETGSAAVILTDDVPASIGSGAQRPGMWYLQAQAPPEGTRAGGC